MNRNCHTFEGDTIVDALAQVRNSLGPGAVILDTRRIKPLPLPGFGRAKVRVVAEAKDPAEAGFERVFSELGALRGELAGLRRAPAAPAESGLEAAAGRLGLSAEGRGDLGPLLAGEPSEEELARALERKIGVTDLLAGSAPVMLVGTTGVGKTTTLAKIAAPLALRGGRGAALVSKDAFRIGAMDQLRTYAELLDIPFESAFTSAELGAAAGRHRGERRVFIDTAGYSPSNAARLAELREAAGAVPGVRVALAVSLAQARDCALIWRSFAALRPCALVVTKLDETDLLWGLLDILRVTGLPLAFTTSGQNVPEDITRADARSLAESLAAALRREL